jgi:maltose alpha-D-glucosyltransferase/alpha-amylase
MDPVYGYQAINVEAQSRAPYSILNWMRRMLALRKDFSVFGRGSIEFLPAHNRRVLVYIRDLGEEKVLCVANLARSVQPVELDLSRFAGMVPVEMLGLTEFPRIGELPYFLTLGPYGFYWFRLQPAPVTASRVAPAPPVEIPQAPGLLVGAAWETLLEGNVRTLIERERLLPFLQRQRWFGGKARRARNARFSDWGVLRRGGQPVFLTTVEVEYEDGGREQYFLPLTICSSAEAGGLEEKAPQAILATVTGARKGVLFDASLDDRFALTLLDAIGRQEQTKTRRGAIRASQTQAFADLRGPDERLAIYRPEGEQSNTSIIYGDRLILKLFRRVEPGINPDFEIGRQLTEKMHFTRVPAVAGALEYEQGGQPSTLGMVQQLVESQADGWTHATDEIARFYDQAGTSTAPVVTAPRNFMALAGTEIPEPVQEAMGAYLELSAKLGRRTAEMHLALAADTSDPAFAPEPLTRDDMRALSAAAVSLARRAFTTLDARVDEGDQQAADGASSSHPGTTELSAQADLISGSREALIERIRSAQNLEFESLKIRVHGDYHLGQVLWAEEDFYLLDFEGEPARPLAQRRQKQSALKDVAGMLRSFSYAAYAGLFTRAAARPAEFGRLEPWAHIWETWASAAFLRGYFETARNAAFLPSEPAQRDDLLRLLMLDKALYELDYELNNRPDWVRVPLWGIFDLL